MKKTLSLTLFFLCISQTAKTSVHQLEYTPIGIGGGGAMSGLAISPYSSLWFLGTDMATLFRSTDAGISWRAVDQRQTLFGTNLVYAVSPGFSSDGKTIFHAAGGINPQRSLDEGSTFQSIKMPLQSGEYIKYWYGSSIKTEVIYCGTNKGLLKTEDKGNSWTRVNAISNEAIGTYIDQGSPHKTVYHATKYRIWSSEDDDKTFKIFHKTNGISIRQFTGGRDHLGLSLVYLDDDGSNACSWVNKYKKDWEASRISQNLKDCGYVWVNSNGSFVRTSQMGGDHLKMAENDSSTIYVTGAKSWIRQYGTKVFLSRDKGASWDLKFHQLNWDVVPYEPWPQDRLEYSAIGLDIGWYDDGYESFAINPRDSKQIAGVGYFFFHTSDDFGNHWQAPFTRHQGVSAPGPQSNWSSSGIEVISIYRMKFHPKNTNIFYAAAADIAGLVSEDHGKSFRITKAQYNSQYDYAFDPADDTIAYAAVGNTHDWPNQWYANYTTSNGGIYLTTNRGRDWMRLTPKNREFNRQFLSVAYDSKNKVIYGGTQETGVVRSLDQGKTWAYFNDGLPAGYKIIPQIEVHPETGNIYALLSGNAPDFTNYKFTGIYYLDLKKNTKKWTLLRGSLETPPEARKGLTLWNYPTSFAIDGKTLWLTDYENNQNWLMTGVWKSTDHGVTWKRKKQVTHPTEIKIDPQNGNKIYVSAYYKIDGSWGEGGQLYSSDGGQTWKKNERIPLQENARGVTLDPTNSKNIFYSFFGGGMLMGPNPND